MSELVARTGRQQQRYEAGCRLVAGCIPYKYRDFDESSDGRTERTVEVLMINSSSGPGLLFPKVQGSYFECAALFPSWPQVIGTKAELSFGAKAWVEFALLNSLLCAQKLLLLEASVAFGNAIRALAIQQYHFPLNIQGGWENDETVEEAARREAVEEAGVRGVIVKFLGHYDFQSKTHQDEYNLDGKCKAALFALLVKEELDSWPEQSIRCRRWLTIPEAVDNCRHAWMIDALVEGFSKWHNNVMDGTLTDTEKEVSTLD